MTTCTTTAKPISTTRPPRTVAIVGRHAHERVFETVLRAVDHDIVFLESTAHAYSHVKRVAPDLVVLCLSTNDPDGCQVLSMLALDAETARIPVLTYMTAVPEAAAEEIAAGDDIFSQFLPISLN